MKRIFCFFLFLSFYCSTNASHFVGYDMQMANITGSDSYKFTLRIYQDVSTAFFGSTIPFNIYENGTNATYTPEFLFTKTGESFVTYNSNQCLTPNANTILKVGTYQYTLPESVANLLINSNGYYIASSNCCRFANATNFLNSYAIGYTMVMEFPKLISTITRNNSSPKFKYPPILKFIVGKNYTIDWSAEDVNSDSLVYSLAPPLNNDSYFKPFGLIPYASGFNLNSNVANGLPDFNINQATGIGTYSPMQSGNYLVAVKVEEYRNGIKIGEIRREMQFSSVLVNEFAPTLVDQLNRGNSITDTVDIGNDYVLNLKANDILGDSLFLKVVPNINPGENLFDVNKFPSLIQWGKPGALQSGATAMNIILKDDTNVYAQFKWKTVCKYARSKPYTIDFVVYDITCPIPLYDTLHVNIYVKKKPNSPPMFISPDTIINNKVLKYYVKQNTWFQLDGDSIIKTYDQDSTQVVNIFMIINPNNPKLSNISFIPNVGLVNSTAKLSVIYQCASDTPYKYTIVAFDDDCLKKDTVYLNIEVNVLPEFVAAENICGVTVDTTSYQSLIFWQRTEPTVSSYVLYKENYATSNFDSIATIPASNLNAYIDLNSIFGNYKLAAMNSCGTKSLKSDIANSVSLGSRVVNSSVVDLIWSPYLNAEQNDSFIVAVKARTSMSYKEIARLPITQMQFTDSVFFQGFAYYRIEVKSDVTCLSPNVYKPRIFSNRTRCDAESVSIFNRIQFNISPNPANKTLSISGLPENETHDLFVFDLLGKEVYSQKVQGTTEVDLTRLSKGVYFVRIGATTRKVIKN